jgi:pre-mRNA-processing factor 8
MTPYHYPSLYYVKADDPDLPAYYFDPIINPVSAFRSTKGSNFLETTDEADLEDLTVPEEFIPILDEIPLYTETTSLGIGKS